MGAGSAAGAATAAVFKGTASLPPLQRLGAMATTAAVTAAATSVGTGIGVSILKNTDILSNIKPTQTTSDLERPESPDDLFINSVFEHGDLISPLENLLYYNFVLIVFIFIFVILLLIIIFNRFVLKSNLNIFSSMFDKFMPKKFNSLFKRYINFSNDFSNRSILISFIFISIGLIYTLCLSLMLSSELFVNIEEYIEVYNYLHSKDKTLFFVFVIKKDSIV